MAGCLIWKDALKHSTLFLPEFEFLVPRGKKEFFLGFCSELITSRQKIAAYDERSECPLFVTHMKTPGDSKFAQK